ncbi:MAG TPA: Uma2 family endonuclease [Chloroflexota bacterium]|nr:Uma2 family endonuclease [Chloroflexota bacterium]
MAIARQHLTLAEFLTLPETKPALEYHSDGGVSQKVAPRPKHSRLRGILVTRFAVFAESRRLAMALPELRTTFAGASHVPDIAVFAWDRLPLDESGELADECRTPPDVAIEIVSPGESAPALARRCQWYVAHGVRLAVLIDPRPRAKPVRIFRPGAAPITLDLSGEIDFGAVVPDLRIGVADLFNALRPPSGAAR